MILQWLGERGTRLSPADEVRVMRGNRAWAYVRGLRQLIRIGRFTWL